MPLLSTALKTVGEVIFLAAVTPLLLLAAMLLFAVCDLVNRVRRAKPRPPESKPSTKAVSIVIPNWNGRHHLTRNLPSVLAQIEGTPGSEVIVVDNGSNDGSAEFLQANFPSVRVIELESNQGFGGGSNAGVGAARNEIVVLLNNDMRVAEGFLRPLVEGFRDPRVFAVSAQIYFTDPNRPREETGLTQGEWRRGRLHVRHVIDDRVTTLFPTFYAGGGSTAYDRNKLLELGGFDSLLEPFYLEDADISYMAWKRGWFVFYEPRSVVYHEHRGTIGKHFSEGEIQHALQQNNLLFAWKNIHEWKRLAGHFVLLYARLWRRLVAGPTPLRPAPAALRAALRRFGRVLRSRSRAQRLALIDDTEAFRRPWGGFFRDRFGGVDPNRERLNVLFVSPYPIEPPLHGGAVFMNQTVRHLRRLANLHLFCLLDEEKDLATNQQLSAICASTEFPVRHKKRFYEFGLLPHAAREFYSPDLLWRLHRSMYVNEIDVLQLDYTQLAVYGAPFRRIATFLFEHDIYFQFVRRGMKTLDNPLVWIHHFYEYLRALRFERQAVRKFDAVQVCTAANRRYLETYAWRSAPIKEGLRAGIDVSRYEYVAQGREPETLLFTGNFRHPPNQEALTFFARQVLPKVRRHHPQARLMVVGAEVSPQFERSLEDTKIEFVGRVVDIRPSLYRHTVFVCPVLSGSGVRVKLLEAFASGIPVVSTTLGAEGLVSETEEILELADTADEFAKRVVKVLDNPEHARALARRARREVEEAWNVETLTRRLEQHYRDVLSDKASRFENSISPLLDKPPEGGGGATSETLASRNTV